MLNSANLRDPVLINTIGHTAGLLLFGAIIVLLVQDWRANGIRQTRLSIIAASLALAWNIGSLTALGSTNSHYIAIGLVMAASFSVLSLLPAVLFHIALNGDSRPIVKAGYVISTAAVVLHIGELFSADEALHQLALILIAVGFATLTILAFVAGRRTSLSRSGQTVEWVSLVALLLFTSTFPHFGYLHLNSAWASEVAWHHIGIPVALIVLLQDYRFQLLDTFVRFLINSGLAAAYVAVILVLGQKFQIWRVANSSMFLTGIALVSLCVSLILFAHVRNILQDLIGRVIFHRQDLEECIRNINLLTSVKQSEDELLSGAAREVARHLGATRFAVLSDLEGDWMSDRPVMLSRSYNSLSRPELAWAEVLTPLRFSSEEVRFLLIGSRRGRQRYLSEDLEDLRRLGSNIVEHVKRFRSEELKRLATESELRALQAQINPHFLFNALNTLYGSIDRSSYQARRMVLNLSEIFRYFLQTDRGSIPLSEELRIVEAYLDIEALRLGDRLETTLDVGDSARSVNIPALLIQPLVENAVKHGIATMKGRGRVTLRAHAFEGLLQVRIEDNGEGFGARKGRQRHGMGLGLENVRRRLSLAYGPVAALNISSSESGTIVSFQIPIAQSPSG